MDDNTQNQGQPTNPMGGQSQDPHPSSGQPQGYTSPASPPMPPQVATPGVGQVPQSGGGGLSDIMEKDVDISNLVQNAGQNQQQSQALFNMLPLQKGTGIQVDERYFVELLAGSISLTYTEKVKILQNFSKLSQYQIDELVKIFEEEKGKFAELEKKHAEQITQFEKEHAVNSQVSVEEKQAEEAKKKSEEEEAERIKRELGL